MTLPPSNDRNSNNFGFLRLLLAALVILAHSPVLVDGNRSRELLTRLFGTLTFGELAVDGFFLISGYLILKSFAQSSSYFEYLSKRVLRIYPGFIVAFVVSLLIGSLAGGKIVGLAGQAFHALTLKEPIYDGAFRGLPRPELNGSMWTIAYEFRCYLLVMLLGVIGVLRNRKIYLVLTLALLICMTGQKVLQFEMPGIASVSSANVQNSVRFCSIFLCGGVFFLFRDRISYTWKAAVVAGTVLIPFMFISHFAETALATLGGYLLFWFALHAKSERISRIGSKVDLSYGLYLYAWPIQKLLIWNFRHISPWMLFGLSTITAGMCAYVSWTLIERPFLRLKGRIGPILAAQQKKVAPQVAFPCEGIKLARPESAPESIT